MLDIDTFKALASRTRLDILKKLDERQKTITELSNETGLSKATVYEHLTILAEAGLIKKVESKNKWVYYKLTIKGMNLLHPEKKKIAILLSLSFLFLSFSFIFFLNIIKDFYAHFSYIKSYEYTPFHLNYLNLFAGIFFSCLLLLSLSLSYIIKRKEKSIIYI